MSKVNGFLLKGGDEATKLSRVLFFERGSTGGSGTMFPSDMNALQGVCDVAQASTQKDRPHSRRCFSVTLTVKVRAQSLLQVT